jgi:hypothetical protein
MASIFIAAMSASAARPNPTASADGVEQPVGVAKERRRHARQPQIERLFAGGQALVLVVEHLREPHGQLLHVERLGPEEVEVDRPPVAVAQGERRAAGQVEAAHRRDSGG